MSLPFPRTSRLLKTAKAAMSTATSATKSATGSDPQWSSAASVQGRTHARDLLSSGWSLSSTRDGLEREFVFRGFTKAMSFMVAVAEECKVRKHHPEWANGGKVYNTVRVRWTTHNPAGLSDMDVVMARFCDIKANEVGVKEVSEASQWRARSEGNMLERLVPAGSTCAPCGGGGEGGKK